MAKRKSSDQWAEAEERILAGLDVAAEYQRWGVRFAGSGTPNARGFIECHADENDSRASGTINVVTGRYHDHRGAGRSLSFWDAAVEIGRFPGDWRDARAHYAKQVGVELPRGKDARPDDKLEGLGSLTPGQALLWCKTKSPITLDALRLCGAMAARWPAGLSPEKQQRLIVLPMYGPGLFDADPLWHMANATGGPIAKYAGKDKPPELVKTLSLGGTGLMGAWGLSHIEEAKWIWVVEGMSDLLALQSLLGERTDHVVVGIPGTSYTPCEEHLALLAGKTVYVLLDCDSAGREAGERLAGIFAGTAKKAAQVFLPYPIVEKGGKDLRDWINSGRTYKDLIELAGRSTSAKPQALPSFESDDDPHRLARAVLRTNCTHRDGLMVRFSNEQWWRWLTVAYRETSAAEFRALLTRWVKQEIDRAYQLRTEKDKPAVSVTRGLVNNVLGAIESLCLVPFELEQPAWLDGHKGPPADQIMAFPNGLLHLPTYARGGQNAMMPPTPRFWNSVGVDYSFDPDAPTPKKWLAFLKQVWPEDKESIEALQEWFGYCLLPDTSQQKILMVKGPRRSGKGTIAKVLRRLIGERNCAAPALSTLDKEFGLAPLLGKTLALVNDAHLSHRSDAIQIVDRLLSISGEDNQTVPRKYLDSMSVSRMRVRFAIFLNEMPDLRDTALPGRILLLRMTESFQGREDPDLVDKLYPELPGILLWAINGWLKLRHRGKFKMPKSAADLLESFEQQSAPIRGFIETRCTILPGRWEFVANVYDEWVAFCKEEGIAHPGSRDALGRALMGVIPTLNRRRRRVDGRLEYYYDGLALNVAPVFESEAEVESQREFIPTEEMD